MYSVEQAEGETVLAMELWWRSAALEALQAYMASILPQASRSQNARLQRLLGSLLQPTLDAVFGSPALQVRRLIPHQHHKFKRPSARLWKHARTWASLLLCKLCMMDVNE